MDRICTQCSAPFDITKDDLAFYEKVSPIFNGKKELIPLPTLCPDCRRQRRLAFRNEMVLYHRKCAVTGRQIVSMYSADKPSVIYDQDVWWSDQWDPLAFGQKFDFEQSFFEQFRALQQKVPRMSLNVLYNENSYFTNYALHNKNSYLVYTADYNESSYYGRFSDRNFSCCDFDFTYDSNECYEVIDIHQCHRCFYSQKCNNSSELFFCYDMLSCHDCMFCGGLRNKAYHVFNKPVEKATYERMRTELFSSGSLHAAQAKAKEFLLTIPRKNLENIQCDGCFGNYLQTSQNAVHCFDCYDLQDTKYSTHLFGSKDCQDWDFVGGSGTELCYQMLSSAHGLVQCAFCMNTWENNHHLLYCDLCVGNKDCFGCVGLRHKQYCILNVQYTREEYEDLVPRIIAHMRKTNEWGEFFPADLSPFGYNESVAQEYVSLTEDEVKSRGWHWHPESNAEESYLGPTIEIPQRIENIDESICEKILRCEATKKPFKIIPQELKFYREMGLPVPRKCPVQRHRERMALRNPHKLWSRKCQKCGKGIETTYPPERPEIVYCEACYLATVY